MTSTYKLSNDMTLAKKVYNCKILIGASGAVTSYEGENVLSVTKETTAGQYTIELSDLSDELTFDEVLYANAMVLGAGGLDDLTCMVLADTLSTDGKFKIQMLAAGVATDVTATNYLCLEVSVLTTVD